MVMQVGVPATTLEKLLREVENGELSVVDFLDEHGEQNPFRNVMKSLYGAKSFSDDPESYVNVVSGSNMEEVSVAFK